MVHSNNELNIHNQSTWPRPGRPTLQDLKCACNFIPALPVAVTEQTGTLCHTLNIVHDSLAIASSAALVEPNLTSKGEHQSNPSEEGGMEARGLEFEQEVRELDSSSGWLRLFCVRGSE